jgi:hypothetical protein
LSNEFQATSFKLQVGVLWGWVFRGEFLCISLWRS